MWGDGRLAGFVDWDTAGPSSRELDLARMALTWVPLQARHVVVGQGFTAFGDRGRRLHLLLDSYGYDGDRTAFGETVVARAELNAAVIRRLGGERLLPFAAQYDEAALEVRSLAPEFWRRP